MLHYYLLCSTFVLGWSLISLEKKSLYLILRK